jgi:hypothetical protein
VTRAGHTLSRLPPCRRGSTVCETPCFTVLQMRQRFAEDDVRHAVHTRLARSGSRSLTRASDPAIHARQGGKTS